MAQKCILHSLTDLEVIDMLSEVVNERTDKVIDDKDIPREKRMEWYRLTETLADLRKKVLVADKAKADGKKDEKKEDGPRSGGKKSDKPAAASTPAS